MSAVGDMRKLRDALDMIVWGGLPTWFEATTAVGEEAQRAAKELAKKYRSAYTANWLREQAGTEKAEQRQLVELLMAETDNVRAAQTVLVEALRQIAQVGETRCAEIAQNALKLAADIK